MNATIQQESLDLKANNMCIGQGVDDQIEGMTGWELKMGRRSWGLSQAEVAKRLGNVNAQDLGKLAHTGEKYFPLYTVKDVSRIFKVCPATVRGWSRMGELSGRYQPLSGRACRLMFTEGTLINSLERNLPSEADLSITRPFDPRTSKAKLVKKILMMNKLFPRRRQRSVQDNGKQT